MPAPQRVEALPAHAIADLESVLRGALLDSRQRWRDLVEMLADIVWETDAAGRFTFIAPDPALGWSAERLIGQPSRLLIGDAAFDPCQTRRPLRDVRAWVRRGDGAPACIALAVVPLLDELGNPCGTRGIGRDVTEEEERSAGVARLLRKEALIDSVLAATRTEVLAERMAQAAAEALTLALGAAGAAVLDIGADFAPIAAVGGNAAEVLNMARDGLRTASDRPRELAGPAGGRLLVAAGTADGVALVLWREAGSRAWDDEDRALLDAAKPLIRVVLDHRHLQRRMSEAAERDPLTGLLNRCAFAEEVERRFARLDHENRPGALLFCDLDNFKHVNDRLGHAAGDGALRAVANLLRAAVRPTDLICRMGGDEFALWLDGVDEYIAGDRAERLRADAPVALAHVGAGPDQPLSLSIGIAVRRPGGGEDLRDLISRADHAMYTVKRAGRAGWLMG